MAYLNGLQDHFVMVGGQQSARSALHLAEIFRLADQAGLLLDPDLAAALSDAGRQTVEQGYSIASHVDRITAIYDEILAAA